MAHRRRAHEPRRPQDYEEYRDSPGRFGDGHRDRDDYYDDRRKRFDDRDERLEDRGERREGFEGPEGERREWERDGDCGEWDGSDEARRRERQRPRRPREGWEREDYKDREWRRSPLRERGRRRWRDSSAERSPGASSFTEANQEQGEWNCQCGALNYKRRSVCYRPYCHAKRSDAAPGVASEMPAAPPLTQCPRQPAAPTPPKQSYSLEDVPRLAAYSAQLYASTAQQQAAYLKYYTHYYTEQLASATEADKVNAAAAVAQAAISQLQARAPASLAPPAAPPSGTDGRLYSAPDTTTYLYDETSGFYYDPGTGLYYDPGTQYYFNNQINQYLYWDVTKFTYLLASAAQPGASQPAVPAVPASSQSETPAEDKSKKPGEKQDKVKVAKKIAKDMERWAKTLNQKKEMARANAMPESSNHLSSSSVSADIGFSVLEQRAPVASAPVVAAPPTLVPSYGPASDSSGDESESVIDWTKLACLLCKRAFPSREVLEKHSTMSDLHRQNLEALKGQKKSHKDQSYRDRAAERRLKYGEDDQPVVRAQRPEPVVSSVPREIGEENIGNRLLQKMGWSAGQGLGRDGQGRVGPLEATTTGLGRKKGIYTAGPGETYKECVKKLTMARYQDLIGTEGNT